MQPILEEWEYVQNHMEGNEAHGFAPPPPPTGFWGIFSGPASGSSASSDSGYIDAAGSFCHAEWMQFLQGLVATDETVQQAVIAQIAAVLLHREDGDQEFADMAAQPTAVATHPMPSEEEVAQMKAKAMAELKAKGKILVAIHAIQEAEEACSEPNPDFRFAIHRLQDRTDPLAHGAAEAQLLVRNVLAGCPRQAQKAMRLADRTLRDIVVLQCVASSTVDPKDRAGFLAKVNEAYGGELAKEPRAALLLSYHKMFPARGSGFPSNNQMAADRRGGPRKRRRRPPGPEGEEPMDEEEYDTCQGTSSSCAAAGEEPMFLFEPEAAEQYVILSDPKWYFYFFYDLRWCSMILDFNHFCSFACPKLWEHVFFLGKMPVV